MAADEKKPVKSHLIPLEIDPASILSLSKGIIFDTIVHNVDYTMNNRLTQPLPWKLAGMSLICDPSRNKKYMQKLQKMQCVPSVICTQIYHSKLLKTESGVLATPGRKVCILSQPPKRLTGVMVCRSIDELLYMESSGTENVHFIQYKLLSYERLATRELVNGPKFSAVGDRVIKTVFDFELTQNNGFPRQLLPVAILSFTRHETADLRASIQSFLSRDEHKTFDKSYLVTSTNVEFDRLREEQERKEDEEAGQDLPSEIVQRRQPLADLSKKSTDTGNARPLPVPSSSIAVPASLRVPPLKIKLSRPEKPLKPTTPLLPVDRKYQCSLKLDRLDLSQYDISNLSAVVEAKSKRYLEPLSVANVCNPKAKSFAIIKPHDHHKPVKRLNTTETKRHLPPLSEPSKNKRPDEAVSIRSSISDVAVLPANKERSSSSSSMSPIYRPMPSILKRTAENTKKKVKKTRSVLPPEYRCSLTLTRMDLSLYDIDLPSIPETATTSLPVQETLIIITSPSNASSPSSSLLSDQPTELSKLPIEPEHLPDPLLQTCAMEQDNPFESDDATVFDARTFDDINIDAPLPPNIIDGFLTPDLNEASLPADVDTLEPSAAEIALRPPALPTDSRPIGISSPSAHQTTTEANNEAVNADHDALAETFGTAVEAMSETALPATADPVSTLITSETLAETVNPMEVETAPEMQSPTEPESSSSKTAENDKPQSPTASSTLSQTLPPLEEDHVLFSIDSLPAPATDTSNPKQQEYLIIVPCSDDEDDGDDFNDDLPTNIKNIATDDHETKNVELQSVSSKLDGSPVVQNPLITRIVKNIGRLSADRLSISSSSSSCSALSTSILPSLSPQPPLHLPEVLLSQKIRNKQQRQENSPRTFPFTQSNLSIPLLAHESLIDPRLIYRLQAITTDLRWSSPCDQCSSAETRPILSPSLTQTISLDRRATCEFADPRRESLQTAVLSSIYQRLKLLTPSLFTGSVSLFQHLLFDQTVFKTNCSPHLEGLFHKIKQIDDITFLQLLRSNDEFELSNNLLQLIFK